ncbi:shikimate kinase, partial [Fructobacillus ficulneus]
MKITLIGFMGSGKTTVAQALSENLNLPLTDLDQLIVDRAGLSIPAYFDQYGKPAFRLFEQEVLVDALAADG